jgi:3-methyladenine DNA glycosylase AlkD
MSRLTELKRYLKSFAVEEKVPLYQGFFKTGKGEYGEGDKFIGVTVPNSRRVAKKFADLSFSEVAKLLASEIHEERLIALLIIVSQFQKADEKGREKIYNFYLKNTKHINNWDLVDLSAGKIVGEYLAKKNKTILYKLAGSKSLWERRIAIISTSNFIGKGMFEHTLKISALLLTDKEDLIHKAVGWMLREVGKRSEKNLLRFLKINYKQLPRTSLRYAIERLPQNKRLTLLKGEFENSL